MRSVSTFASLLKEFFNPVIFMLSLNGVESFGVASFVTQHFVCVLCEVDALGQSSCGSGYLDRGSNPISLPPSSLQKAAPNFPPILPSA